MVALLIEKQEIIKKISLSSTQIKKVFDSYQTLFSLPPLSKKMIIDIIVNKNPDGFCIDEKVEKTMAQDGNF